MKVYGSTAVTEVAVAVSVIAPVRASGAEAVRPVRVAVPGTKLDGLTVTDEALSADAVPVNTGVTTITSPTAAVAVRVSVNVAAVRIAPLASAVPVMLPPETAALDGTTLNNPKPNADTATSAMRLIDVFVDIDFLSVVDLETFSRSAWA